MSTDAGLGDDEKSLVAANSATKEEFGDDLVQTPGGDVIPPTKSQDSSHGTSSSAYSQDESPKANNATPEPEHEKGTTSLLSRIPLPQIFAWIPSKLNSTSLKPVARSSVCAWVALILVIVPQTERALGQASFLVLISAFLSPPNEPLIAVLERDMITLFFVCLSWAWTCLGLKLASLARSEIITKPNPALIFQGAYIEAGPAVILATFLALGSAFFCYLKARLGPGPFIFATVFGCLSTDIMLTTAQFFPYPYYMVGRIILIPLSVGAALSIACSLLIFPETVNAQFAKRMRNVLSMIRQVVQMQPGMLAVAPTSPDFNLEPCAALASAAEGALLPLAMAERLITREFSWGKFSGSDLNDLQEFARNLVVRTTGFVHYFRIIEVQAKPQLIPHKSRTQPGTPETHTESLERSSSRSQMSTNTASRVSTHQSGLSVRIQDDGDSDDPSSMRQPAANPERGRHHHKKKSVLFAAEGLQLPHEGPVGVFESQRYMNLESRIDYDEAAILIEKSMKLLASSSADLLSANMNGLDHVIAWLDRMNADRFTVFRKRQKTWEVAVADNEAAVLALEKAIALWRSQTRLEILEPYRAFLDPAYPGDRPSTMHCPPSRILFHTYVYQYHLLHFSLVLLDLLKEIHKLERDRQKSRLWGPCIPWRKYFSANAWWSMDIPDHEDDEDPERIPGMTAREADLGTTQARDPDALPPANAVEYIGSKLYRGVQGLTHGNALFALKAAILTVLLCTPLYLKSTAPFVYKNKGVWGIFMAQFTLARFRGDTAFGFISRVFATSVGCVIGMALWYISAGHGAGNPYGLAAICAVCFPVFMLFRLYAPGNPLTILILFVTVALIIGYSWQDTHMPSSASPGYGVDVAWRRLVLVLIGVTAAFLFSFLPPSTSLRKYHRTANSKTIGELGVIYCSVVSYANSPHDDAHEESKRLLTRNLVAIRSKLKRARILKANASYEFSLQGKWPTDRYNALLQIQLELAYLLSHLFGVTSQLDPAWSCAFLRRTRFLDTDFLGDMLAIISMCSTSLKTGYPLPQITPSPLMDRFLVHDPRMLGAYRGSEPGEQGLPQKITMSTLEDEQYLCFCVGVACAFGIVLRLDRLVLATKELVGECFHVDGLGVPVKSGHTG